jgi:hypothetical protein
MTDREQDPVAEALSLLAQESAAMNDVLGLLCFVLASTQPETAAALKKTFDNLSTQTEFEATRAFTSLCRHLSRSLSQDLDAPLLSMKSRFSEEDVSPGAREVLRRIMDRKA